MKHILIVDDEPHAIRVLKRSMEEAGYAVHSAPNGQAALEQILERKFDAVITDVIMPRMNGQQLCEKIEENLPDRAFPIVVMTSRVDRELRDLASQRDGVVFMEKPLSPRRLIRWLDENVSGLRGHD